jgi:hypothetical protein
MLLARSSGPLLHCAGSAGFAGVASGGSALLDVEGAPIEIAYENIGVSQRSGSSSGHPTKHEGLG